MCLEALGLGSSFPFGAGSNGIISTKLKNGLTLGIQIVTIGFFNGCFLIIVILGFFNGVTSTKLK